MSNSESQSQQLADRVEQLGAELEYTHQQKQRVCRETINMSIRSMSIIIITGVLITARVRTLCISLHCIISMCICFLLLLIYPFLYSLTLAWHYKALSRLKVTTRTLDESVGGREELLRQLEDLKCNLSESEERCAFAEERYSSLAVHQKLSEQIRNIEDRMTEHR